MSKHCPKCGTTKPVTEFCNDRSRPDGKFPWCKPCHRAHTREYKARKVAELGEDGWRRLQNEKKRARHASKELREKYLLNTQIYSLKKRYGIGPEDVLAMLEDQDGRCAICGEEPPDPGPGKHKKRSLVVDHCHETGRVRGMLCNACNCGLGHFADDPERLAAAIDYLGH